MKNLKSFCCVVGLTLIFGTSVVVVGQAGAGGCEPGIILTPPCAAAQITPDDPAVVGQTDALPASSGTEISVANVTIELLQIALPLF